eukprot:jgi/Botrbrau1/22185/Bobra.168_1s0017.1
MCTSNSGRSSRPSKCQEARKRQLDGPTDNSKADQIECRSFRSCSYSFSLAKFANLCTFVVQLPRPPTHTELAGVTDAETVFNIIPEGCMPGRLP